MSDAIDEAKLEQLIHKVIGDVAGAMSLFMAYLGDKAGVFEAMDGAGPLTCEALAAKTGLSPKYLHEWLGSVAAAGYVTFHSNDETFELTPEQALVFTREGQPANMQGFVQILFSQFETHEKAVEVFKSGKGRPWSDHTACCFCGTDRFFRPGYAANLVENWIPSLAGVEAKLKAGAKVADIGCGHGSSTVLMAQAYPNSTIYGIDFHAPSIEAARAKAAEAGVNNVEFVVASAQDYPGEGFDFACIFDALHDMGDPVGAARHIRETLAPDGTFMLVEPRAGDTMAENMHPIGQIFYAASTVVCTPASLAAKPALPTSAARPRRRPIWCWR
jgi:SAM-dependent methyltransferase